MPDITVMIKETSYKPGWRFEYQEESWREVLVITAALPDARDLSRGTCNFTMKRTIPAHLRVNPSMEAFHAWLREQIREIEFHEINEFLRYGGVVVEDPHAGVSAGAGGGPRPAPVAG